MILTSPSFADGAMLPFECAYEGANASPALSWSGAPSGTRSFALSCIDHSSPNPVGWVHWLQWNIPAFETRRLPGLSPYACLDDGCEQGLNDFLEFGWGGPCPPLGLHRYQFSLYALDCLVRPESPRLDALWNAMPAIYSRRPSSARIMRPTARLARTRPWGARVGYSLRAAPEPII